MARLVGVDLPRDKRMEIALTYIFGVGRTRSNEILAATGIDKDLRTRDLTDDQLVDAMLAHPILINRPIVVSPKGVKLCRPSEDVLDLLPPQRGEFVKEDGERVVDEHGRRVATA